ncbi:MAG TPA: hypothetical protein RMH99_13720 [Sandaracinaceae bacterium LLY-WYZ-13_1]|nr:hypothetical protein [Sandaracinaceae bacterium LLY-WYZ-13_1]
MVLALVSWSALALAVGFFAAAQPPTQLGFFARISTRSVRAFWDARMLGVAVGCVAAAWALSIVGLAVHSMRVRRRGDVLHGPLVAACVLASLGMVAALWALVR